MRRREGKRGNVKRGREEERGGERGCEREGEGGEGERGGRW